MMVSGKDFLKSHVLSWRRRKVYSDWEDVIMLQLPLPAGCSRSLGQQPGKLGYRPLIAWTVAPHQKTNLEGLDSGEE